MYVFTEDGSIVNLEKFEIVRAMNKKVVAISSDDVPITLHHCDSELDARLLIQDIFKEIDCNRKVMCLGEFVMPF